MNKFLKSYLAILVPVYVLHFTLDGNESIIFVLFWLPLMLLFLTFLGILASGLLADHRGVEHKWWHTTIGTIIVWAIIMSIPFGNP